MTPQSADYESGIKNYGEREVGVPGLRGKLMANRFLVTRWQDPGGFPAVDFNQFPHVAVQVHGVRVVGAVAHCEPVAGALPEQEFALVGIGLPIDQP